MTTWIPEIGERAGPRYVAIADALSGDIAAGVLHPGDRLPTHRELAWRLGVTVGTITRAYGEATRRGLVSGEVGRGTYIRGPLAAAEHLLTVEDATANDSIELGFAYPPAVAELSLASRALQDLAGEAGCIDALGYQSHVGTKAHRAAGAAWLARRGIKVPAERVLVTAGGQHAVVLALAAATRPGDRILAESPTYPGIQTAAHLLGLRLDGLAMDEEGLVPAAFAAACRGGDIKALYVLPTLHNPTNITMPEARRREIADIAVTHGVTVIEDEVCGFPAERPPPVLTSFAPDHGLYLTSLSKTVAPGLRVGYITAPATYIDRLAGAIRATCWMASSVTTELATRLIRGGDAAHIFDARRREARARLELARSILGPWHLTDPDDAFYLWLRLPEAWSASEFAAAALRRGVRITPAEPFVINRLGMVEAVRICLGPPRSRHLLEEGLRRLAGLLREGPVAVFSEVM